MQQGISTCTANQRELMFRKSVVIFFPFMKNAFSFEKKLAGYTISRRKWMWQRMQRPASISRYGSNLETQTHWKICFRTLITRWWTTTRTPSETFSSTLLERKPVSNISCFYLYFSYTRSMLCLSHFALHFTQNVFRVLRQWSSRDLRRS